MTVHLEMVLGVFGKLNYYLCKRDVRVCCIALL